MDGSVYAVDFQGCLLVDTLCIYLFILFHNSPLVSAIDAQQCAGCHYKEIGPQNHTAEVGGTVVVPALCE